MSNIPVNTIKAIKEDKPNKKCARKNGGGRKKITEKYPQILYDLENLVEPLTREDPESVLRWTCKSTYKLRDELVAQGYAISQSKVGELLSCLSDHPGKEQ